MHLITGVFYWGCSHCIALGAGIDFRLSSASLDHGRAVPCKLKGNSVNPLIRLLHNIFYCVGVKYLNNQRCGSSESLFILTHEHSSNRTTRFATAPHLHWIRGNCVIMVITAHCQWPAQEVEAWVRTGSSTSHSQDQNDDTSEDALLLICF